MNRRSFFKFLPVAPLALVAEGARAVTASGAPDEGGFSIVLTASKKREVQTSGKYIIGLPYEEDPTRHVQMMVGNDGFLWLRAKNDEWKRVVTE